MNIPENVKAQGEAAVRAYVVGRLTVPTLEEFRESVGDGYAQADGRGYLLQRLNAHDPDVKDQASTEVTVWSHKDPLGAVDRPMRELLRKVLPTREAAIDWAVGHVREARRGEDATLRREAVEDRIRRGLGISDRVWPYVSVAREELRAKQGSVA